MKTVLITEAQCKTLLFLLKINKIEYVFNPMKNELEFFKDQTVILKFRLPISLSSPKTDNNFPDDKENYVIIMIRSGIASVGYFEDGMPMDHKVFRAYMVRKKQGSSQIKYLKTKGKSRAGSRVRLAESLEFFENINLRLGKYFDENIVERIGLSCPITLIPFLYGSKKPPPFNKKDERILKIPKHVQNPIYDSLLAINQYLLKGELKYSEEGKNLFDFFMKTIIEETGSEEEENW